MRKHRKFFSQYATISPKKGVALFVSMLLSMSIAVVALSTMTRISQSARSSGEGLSEKKLLNYANSAALIASAEVQERMNASPDEEAVYIISGPAGPGSFVFYPDDIASGNRDIRFAYRAVANRFAGMGQTPPGAKVALGMDTFCYDITVDVKEVFYVGHGTVTTADSETDIGNNFYFGRGKSIGIISCYGGSS